MPEGAPSISVVMPTLNAERHLEECLTSLREQEYAGTVELLVPDAGSTDRTLEIVAAFDGRALANPLKSGEAGKAVGVKAARGDLVLLLDSDNVLVGRDWLTRMAAPFVADPEVFCAEPARFAYRRDDHFINRWHALLGAADPLTIYTGNYARQSVLTGDWTSFPYRAQERDGWQRVEVDPRAVPVLGANGFMIRRAAYEALPVGEYLFDLDYVHDLVQTGRSVVARPDVGVVHLFCDSAKRFRTKTRRRVDDFFYFQREGGALLPVDGQAPDARDGGLRAVDGARAPGRARRDPWPPPGTGCRRVDVACRRVLDHARRLRRRRRAGPAAPGDARPRWLAAVARGDDGSESAWRRLFPRVPSVPGPALLLLLHDADGAARCLKALAAAGLPEDLVVVAGGAPAARASLNELGGFLGARWLEGDGAALSTPRPRRWPATWSCSTARPRSVRASCRAAGGRGRRARRGDDHPAEQRRGVPEHSAAQPAVAAAAGGLTAAQAAARLRPARSGCIPASRPRCRTPRCCGAPRGSSSARSTRRWPCATRWPTSACAPPRRGWRTWSPTSCSSPIAARPGRHRARLVWRGRHAPPGAGARVAEVAQDRHSALARRCWPPRWRWSR